MVKYRYSILIVILVLVLAYEKSANNLSVFKPEKPLLQPNVVNIVPEPKPIPEIPKVQLQLIDVPKYRSIEDDTIYGDVLSHSEKTPFGNAHGRATNVHETAHGISSELTNKYYKNYSSKIEGLYYGNGKGIILESPQLKINEVSAYIPEKFRSYRFQLYFIDQLKYWNDYPLYILDEWTAYIWGARCAVEDYKTKNIDTKADSVSGSLEFSLYTMGLCLAIKAKDNDYWKNNIQFKLVVKEHLQRAETVFFEGRDIFKSNKQETLLNELKNSDDSEPIKQLLKSEFDSVFLRQLNH
jgi:hypothetical protein